MKGQASPIMFIIVLLGLILFIAGAIFLAQSLSQSYDNLQEEQQEEELISLSCPETCNDGNSCTTDYCNESTNYECKTKAIIPCCGDNRCDFPETCSSCSQDCSEFACIGKENIILNCDEPCPLGPDTLEQYRSHVLTAFDQTIQDLNVDLNTFGTRQGTVYPITLDVCLDGVNCDNEVLATNPILYTYPGFKAEFRSVIYILPEGLCQREVKPYQCTDDLNLLQAPDSAVHEFTHHLFSLKGCHTWTQNEGIAEYVQEKYQQKQGDQSGIKFYFDRYKTNCKYLPNNWEEYDGDLREICGLSSQCDVLTGKSTAPGWEEIDDCRDFKYDPQKEVFQEGFNPLGYPYTETDYREDIKWNDPRSGDHNRGLAFFLELEDLYGFNMNKMGLYLKSLNQLDDENMTKQKLANVVGVNIDTLWDQYELENVYETVNYKNTCQVDRERTA